jgi:DNA-binding response OmpR family regulator
MRILVIDDMAEMRALIRRVLVTQGHVVDAVATVGEARGLDPGQYDVLLVDDHLGQNRGTDLVVSLAVADPAVAERCVVMTGGTGIDLPKGAALLVKPFNPAELIEAVLAVPGRAFAEAALSAGDGLRAQVPGLRTCDQAVLADFWHDGPAQHLSAATFALELIARSVPVASRERIDEVLQWLDSVASGMRDLLQRPGGASRPGPR